MSNVRVLISDNLSHAAHNLLEQAGGFDIDDRAGVSPDELLNIIADYDMLIVRSRTQVTADVLQAGKHLKLVGRAGIGVDNIDIPAASRNGVMVMNAPHGNAVSAAELAIAHMFSVARLLVNAGQSMRAGKWEKKKLKGHQIGGSTLAVIGLGNIGRIVASRALGLQMRVLGFDPFVTPEQMRELGLEPHTELESLLKEADFVTLHTPKTPQTTHLLSTQQFGWMKPSAYLINCARGGIVDEVALNEALEAGELAGAALDVFEQEPPAADNPLLSNNKVFATPHLGAATHEAQDYVAIELAEQIRDYAHKDEIRNVLNLAHLS